MQTTAEYLQGYLAHPDGYVRVCADWALGHLGEPTKQRISKWSDAEAERYIGQMNRRLRALAKGEPVCA